MESISKTFNFLTPSQKILLDQVPFTEDSAPFIIFLKNPPQTFPTDLLSKIEQLRQTCICPPFERIENGLDQIEELYIAAQRNIALCDAGSIKAEIGSDIYASHFGSLIRSSSSSPTLRLTPRLTPPCPSPVDQSPHSPVRTLAK